MTPAARARWSFGAALFAHAAFVVWTHGRHAEAAVSRANEPESEIDVVVDAPSEPAPVAKTEEPAAVEPAAAVTPTVTTHAVAPVARTNAEAPAVAPTPTAVVTAEPTSTGSNWTFSPTGHAPPSASGMAVEGDLARATAGGVASVLAESDRKAAARAKKPQIFTARDLSLGLVPGRQFVGLTRDRVRTSMTPENGHALLEFWTNGKGVVSRVRVVSASSDPSAWAEVAEGLAADARAAIPLNVPKDADGLIVTIDVSSEMKTTSGASPTANGLTQVMRAIQNPLDSIVDSNTSPKRIVIAKVVGVESL